MENALSTLKPESSTYAIGRCLGSGLSGTVYEAYRSDSKSNFRTRVALKVFMPAGPEEGWMQEFESLRRVKSKFCVQVHGWERFSEGPALVLEFIEGISLRQSVNQGYWTPELIENLTFQILTGLRDLKEAFLFHGDLSPNNVMLTSHGQVRLVDFGLGNHIAGHRLLTPEFASPKVVEGQAPNFFTDVYSLEKIIHWISKEVGLLDVPQIKELLAQLSNIANGEISEDALLIKLQTSQPSVTSPVFQTQPKTFRTQAVTIPKIQLDIRKIAVMVIGVGFFLGFFMAKYQQKGFQSAKLSLRSTEWAEVWLNNKSRGYTPLEIASLKPGTYELRWRAKGRREKSVILTLNPNQHMVLGDSFFKRR